MRGAIWVLEESCARTGKAFDIFNDGTGIGPGSFCSRDGEGDIQAGKYIGGLQLSPHPTWSQPPIKPFPAVFGARQETGEDEEMPECFCPSWPVTGSLARAEHIPGLNFCAPSHQCWVLLPACVKHSLDSPPFCVRRSRTLHFSFSEF